MILRILNHGDLCSLTGVVLILLWVGSTVSYPRERSWGAAAAVSAFLLYACYSIVAFRIANAESLFQIVLRSLVVSGLVLGLSWTLSPLATTFRSHVWQRWRMGFQSRQEHARRRSQEEADRRRAAAERDAWERSAPQRERAKREAARFAKAQARAQKQRQEARIACETLYFLHAPEIGNRFSQEKFNEFFHRHLGDEHSLEYVEKQARQLQDIIHQHLQKVEPEPSPSDAIEREEARAEVRACYAEYADLLRDTFPLVRFNVKLRLRIPDSVTPHEAWKESLDMIHELLETVAEEKERLQRLAPRRPFNPPIDNI